MNKTEGDREMYYSSSQIETSKLKTFSPSWLVENDEKHFNMRKNRNKNDNTHKKELITFGIESMKESTDKWKNCTSVDQMNEIRSCFEKVDIDNLSIGEFISDRSANMKMASSAETRKHDSVEFEKTKLEAAKRIQKWFRYRRNKNKSHQSVKNQAKSFLVEPHSEKQSKHVNDVTLTNVFMTKDNSVLSGVCESYVSNSEAVNQEDYYESFINEKFINSNVKKSLSSEPEVKDKCKSPSMNSWRKNRKPVKPLSLN